MSGHAHLLLIVLCYMCLFSNFLFPHCPIPIHNFIQAWTITVVGKAMHSGNVSHSMSEEDGQSEIAKFCQLVEDLLLLNVVTHGNTECNIQPVIALFPGLHCLLNMTASSKP